MRSILQSVLEAAERVLPWRDRRAEDRQKAAIGREIKLSKEARERAQRVIARGITSDIARRYERYDGVVRR